MQLGFGECRGERRNDGEGVVKMGCLLYVVWWVGKVCSENINCATVQVEVPPLYSSSNFRKSERQRHDKLQNAS